MPRSPNARTAAIETPAAAMSAAGIAADTRWATGTPATKAGLYGTFKLNATTGAWSYELDNAKANSLKANEVVQEKWEVTSKDGSKDVILVDVIGADDATTIAAAAGAHHTVLSSDERYLFVQNSLLNLHQLANCSVAILLPLFSTLTEAASPQNRLLLVAN